MILSFVLALVFMPLPALLPAYTQGVLAADADVGGYLMATMGAGGLIATFIIASFGFTMGTGRSGLLALVVGSTAILAMAQSHWLSLSLVMVTFMGFAQTFFIVGNMTLIQTMVPDTLRGRVSSIWSLQHALNPLAIVLTGLFIDLYTAARAWTIIASNQPGVGGVLPFRLPTGPATQVDACNSVCSGQSTDVQYRRLQGADIP